MLKIKLFYVFTINHALCHVLCIDIIVSSEREGKKILSLWKLQGMLGIKAFLVL